MEAGSAGAAADRTYCLGVTNRMLSGWSTEIGPLHYETTESLTWTGSQASRTIGTGGNFNTPRPEKVLLAQYRDGSDNDFPLDIISHQGYQAIQDKSRTSSMPLAIAYNPTIASSLGTLFIWPVPSADVTIRLTSYKPFTTISDQTATVVLPSGYEAALVYNLACLIAGTFGRALQPMTAREAYRTKTALIRANIVPQPMKSDWGGDCADDINRWTNS